jgi:glycosyltransferase involved in cell wall biosynthesis
MTTQADSVDLAVAITAHNSERTIRRVIESVGELARRVVVVDSGSTDRTPDICRELGAEVIHESWRGHVEQKQFAIDHCQTHQWILLLDSDESLEPELVESMRNGLNENDPNIDGWWLNRKVWMLGGWLHYTYQPEWRLRLFRGGKGVVRGVNPHDYIHVEGRTARLRGDVRHDAWADLRDMATRHIRYAEIACDHARSGGTPFHILVSPPAALLKQLVLKRGIMDGWRGVIAAGMASSSVMLKHSFMAARKVSRRQESGR